MSIPADPAVLSTPAGGAGLDPGLDVDAALLLRRLDEMAAFGARPGLGGITRTGLSGEETAARRHLAARCREDGLTTHVDQAANLIVRRAGADHGKPVVLLGSHLDTVVGGGRLDGTYGVMAACEVVRVLARAEVELPVEPVAIAFTNEEGAGFPYPFFGSLALTGKVDVAAATAAAERGGLPLRAALRAAGGDLDTLGAAAWAPGSIACYLELHIEQGPVLEARGIPIGVVDAITGRTILDIAVQGRQGHAGTTPMALRRDALAVAARVVLAVEELATERGLCAVGTVGRLDAEPNVTNVIPGRVELTAEIRDSRPERLRAAERALTGELARLGSATGIDIAAAVRPVTAPTPTTVPARQAIAAAADALGLAHLEMFSSAGHDAQIVSDIAPIGMIFVPSHDGVSHAPEEHTDDAHLIAGARTLLHSVLHLAGR
jgi:N-carbamoyl-L-amino-acid hydrolase